MFCGISYSESWSLISLRLVAHKTGVGGARVHVGYINGYVIILMLEKNNIKTDISWIFFGGG